MKRRLVIALLCTLALWPAAQIALVERCGVDRWELFGWGMYTCPHLGADVRAFALPDGRPILLAPNEREALQTFQLAWRHLGRLASPAAAAELILDQHPQIEGVRLVATRLELDPQTDHVAARESAWVLRRGKSIVERQMDRAVRKR